MNPLVALSTIWIAAGSLGAAAKTPVPPAVVAPYLPPAVGMLRAPTLAMGIIDRSGRSVVPLACDRVSYPGRGDWVGLGRDGRAGFFNLRNGQTTGMIFDVIGYAPSPGPALFANGPEPVSVNGSWGYVEQTGHIAIPFRFGRAERFAADGVAIAGGYGTEGEVGFIDRSGNDVIPPESNDARDFDSHGLANVKSGRNWGLIDRQGRIVADPEYWVIGPFADNGLAVVYGQDHRVGAIDTHGRLIVPMKFTALDAFAPDGLAAASTDPDAGRQPPLRSNHWGFIDGTGAFVIAPTYKYTQSTFDVGYRRNAAIAPLGDLLAISTDKAGVPTSHFLDGHGREVQSLPPGLVVERWYSDRMLVVRDSQRDSRGQVRIFDPKDPGRETAWVVDIGDFGANGLATALRIDKDGRHAGFIDRSGKLSIPLEFYEVFPFGDDRWAHVTLRALKGSRTTAAYVDRSGKITLKTDFENASGFSKAGYAIVSNQLPYRTLNPLPASDCGVAR